VVSPRGGSRLSLPFSFFRTQRDIGPGTRSLFADRLTGQAPPPHTTQHRHWPIGLLYDLHATSRHLGLLPPRPVTIPPSFASVFAPFDEDGSQGQDAGAGGVRSQELPDLLSLSVGGGGATSRRGSNALASSSSSTTLRGGGPLGSGGASSRLRTPSAPPRQQGGTAPSSTSMNRARSAAAAAASASTVPATSSTSSSPSTSISFQPSSSSTVSSPTTGGGVTNEVTMATRPWRIRLRIRNLKGGANGGGGDASSSSRTAAAEAAGVLDGGGGGRNRVEEVRTGFMALVKVRAPRGFLPFSSTAGRGGSLARSD
jgi:hypothetical protein